MTNYLPPGGPGIRVDGGVFSGWRVPGEYDSLLVKIIAFGKDRHQAISRMQRALEETVIEGIRTNLPLHRAIFQDERFISGAISTRFLERLPFLKEHSQSGITP
ncbi:MAG: hypothetical protein NZM37_06900 [Sandaracinaceae bacterium]|nr:hypothetical protein [Sandaracinaceae bacterium]